MITYVIMIIITTYLLFITCVRLTGNIRLCRGDDDGITTPHDALISRESVARTPCKTEHNEYGVSALGTCAPHVSKSTLAYIYGSSVGGGGGR